jgi:hypothetical protein
VALIVKRWALEAGFDPALFAGHSLRSGLATAAAKAGKSERSIMKQTGHRSVSVVRRYIRDAELFTTMPLPGSGFESGAVGKETVDGVMAGHHHDAVAVLVWYWYCVSAGGHGFWMPPRMPTAGIYNAALQRPIQYFGRRRRWATAMIRTPWTLAALGV